jgi:hypothetical protein
MTDQIDAMVRDAAPVADDEVRSLSLDGAEAELYAAILRQRRPLPEARRRRRMRWGVRGWSGVGAATAVAVAILMVSLAGEGERLGTSPGRAWAAPALRVANAVPRLLIGEPGWAVRRADQFTVHEGEMTFGDGAHTIDLHWRSGDLASWVADGDANAQRLPDADVLGTTATLFLYPGPGNDLRALWPRGRYTMELRAGSMTIAEYRRVLGSLTEVSVDDWLGAMPPSVVLPRDTQAVVDGMLADMELPDGFDASALRAGEAIRDRYQLGARVAGAVACAWIERWIAARDAGDAGDAAAAVSAMQGSRDWTILREMTAEGDYPKVLWEYADAMKGDGTVLGGRVLTVEESYRSALGC